MATPHGMPASGNQFIDAQHSLLTELIHVAAESARQGGEGFAEAVQAFHHALADHFAVEGIIYRGAGFGASEEHDEAHSIILARTHAITDSLILAQSTSDRHSIVDELERILFDHELLEDSAYWEAINDRGDEPVIIWDAELDTGIAWIDDQHRHMVAIINELAIADQAGHQVESAELMARFQRHARQHFAAEERYLATLGQSVSAHRRDHARLMDELDALVQGGESGVLAMQYLRFWILDHIRTSDLPEFCYT